MHDLREVAAASVDAARAAQPRITIDYQPPPAPVTASFDRDRIRQVTTILLDNAVKYTPGGGRITVTVRRVADRVELAVADTGIGIPADDLPHIFERFYRVDASRAAGGTGLGLAIAHQIAEQHGGTLTVVSSPGHGSTFTLTLPVSTADAPDALLPTISRWHRLRRRRR